MRTSECALKKVLPFTIDVTRKEEREKLDQLGSEIAAKKGLHYEGYSLCTTEPYSIGQAKPVLYFD
jgi:hypothetical protein